MQLNNNKFYRFPMNKNVGCIGIILGLLVISILLIIFFFIGIWVLGFIALFYMYIFLTYIIMNDTWVYYHYILGSWDNLVLTLIQLF